MILLPREEEGLRGYSAFSLKGDRGGEVLADTTVEANGLPIIDLRGMLIFYSSFAL